MRHDAVQLVRRNGDEPFHDKGRALDFELLSFWRWACSDITGNALRGLVAEYLVARAVGADQGVRTEWDAYDVMAPNSLKIEVKSSGYVQSWKQLRLSAIKFDIAPKRAWTAATNTVAEVATRSADVYVFAVHAHREKATVDVLDVSQWAFYVLPTAVLNERRPTQKSITLSSLLTLEPVMVGFEGLGDAIGEASPPGDVPSG